MERIVPFFRSSRGCMKTTMDPRERHPSSPEVRADPIRSPPTRPPVAFRAPASYILFFGGSYILFFGGTQRSGETPYAAPPSALISRASTTRFSGTRRTVSSMALPTSSVVVTWLGNAVDAHHLGRRRTVRVGHADGACLRHQIGHARGLLHVQGWLPHSRAPANRARSSERARPCRPALRSRRAGRARNERCENRSSRRRAARRARMDGRRLDACGHALQPQTRQTRRRRACNSVWANVRGASRAERCWCHQRASIWAASTVAIRLTHRHTLERDGDSIAVDMACRWIVRNRTS
jgi:hypothetical protein